MFMGFPAASVVKNPPINAGDTGDTGLIPGLGGCLEGGHGNPLQYSCLENPMDRGAWWATVHRVKKSQIQLKQLSTHLYVESTKMIQMSLLTNNLTDLENKFMVTKGKRWEEG